MRIERIGDATLYLGDCLEVLPTLGKVDAVITDPPYGVNKAEWDRHIPDFDWLTYARERASVVYVFCGNGNQYVYPVPDWTLAWMRPGSTQYAKSGRFSHWEPILVYGRNTLWVDARVFKPNSGVRGIDHPSIKPVFVVEWLVGGCGDMILDPFMGSGTTGIACANLGRRFIGIEIEPKYFDIACKRISDAQAQLKMAI